MLKKPSFWVIVTIILLCAAVYARYAHAQGGQELSYPEFAPMHDVNDPNHWYPSECCNLRDCFPLEAGDVEEKDGGYYINSTGEHFNYTDARASGDNKFHRCSSAGNKKAMTLPAAGNRKKGCFFAPKGGM